MATIPMKVSIDAAARRLVQQQADEERRRRQDDLLARASPAERYVLDVQAIMVGGLLEKAQARTKKGRSR